MRRCKLLGQFQDHRVIMAPKRFLPKSPLTETNFTGIRMGYRYEPESVETKMVGGPYIGEPAHNRG